MATLVTEFAVNMTSLGCAQAVEHALNGQQGITSYEIDLQNQVVTIHGTVPSSTLLAMLEGTGKKVAIKGQSAERGEMSAVCMLQWGPSVRGVVRFAQMKENRVLIDGSVAGLPQGLHNLAVHEFGDLSSGCESTGDCFAPQYTPAAAAAPAGDLGNIVADESGCSSFLFEHRGLQVWDLIGRSLVVHVAAGPTTAAGPGIGCGIIARAAAAFQNAKKLCTCDGTTIFDGDALAKRSRLAGPSSNL
eukprot:m.17231 g.17231  ORF g.17231 m.17231 type:complete len:246 (+) comp7080_c0_seq1:108-845(+)